MCGNEATHFTPSKCGNEITHFTASKYGNEVSHFISAFLEHQNYFGFPISAVGTALGKPRLPFTGHSGRMSRLSGPTIDHG